LNGEHCMIKGRINRALLAVTLVGLTVTSGCSARRAGPPLEKRYETISARSVGDPSLQSEEGVADYIWEEPMVDVVDIPPGMDPEGHYYRPGHQEILEIRPGKWKYYRGDEEHVR